MIYKVIFKAKAKKDIASLKNNNPKYYHKVSQLLHELEDHPRTGTGHPKPLGGDRKDQWSRRISDKHRLVYEIQDEVVIVLILSAWGHYDDK